MHGVCCRAARLAPLPGLPPLRPLPHRFRCVCRWRGLLEADDSALFVEGNFGEEADYAVEAARLVAEKAFSQPTYVYAAVDEEGNEVGLALCQLLAP